VALAHEDADSLDGPLSQEGGAKFFRGPCERGSGVWIQQKDRITLFPTKTFEETFGHVEVLIREEDACATHKRSTLGRSKLGQKIRQEAMGLVKKMVGLRGVIFVLHQSRGVGEKVEDRARAREGLTGRQEGTSVENEVEAAAPYQITNFLVILFRWQRFPLVEGVEVGDVGVIHHERGGGAGYDVMRFGFREEVADRSREALQHDGVSQVDVADDEDTTEGHGFSEGREILPSESGSDGRVLNEGVYRLVQESRAPLRGVSGQGTGKFEDGFLKIVVHGNNLSEGLDGRVTVL
jgi:hypothetical protein